MGVTLGARFVAYDAAGARRGVLPYPLSGMVQDVFNDVGTGSIDYLADGQNSSLLEGLCEVAAEVNDGRGWAEVGARWMRLKRGASVIEETRTRRYSLHSYGVQLAKMRMLREETVDEGGDRQMTGTVGAIVKTLFDEAKNRAAVTAFTYDFTATVDSNGVAWGGDLPPVTMRFGDDLLSLLRMLADNGACDWKIQGRTLRMFKPDTLGVDKSSTIRLFNGVDIVEAPDDEDATEMAGRIGVIGDDGRTYEAISPSVNPWGLWEETVNASGVKDIGGLQFIGEAEQRRRSAPRVQMTRKIRTVNVRHLPVLDYNVGDTITAPNDKGEPGAVRVRELQLDVGPEGVSVNATLNDRILERDIRDRRTWQGMLGGAGSSAGGSGSPTGGDKRKPAAPTGLVANSVHLWSPTGEPFAVLDVGYVPVSKGTDGKTVSVARHELYGRKNVTGEVWRKITDASGADSRITYSPMPVGEKWQVKLRAVSSSGVIGDFSGVVNITLAADTTPPPKPAAATATTRLGQIILSWGGLTDGGDPQPIDFSHCDVLMATSPAGAGVVVGQIGVEDTFVAPEQPYNAQRWFGLVAVDTSGNRSPESARVVAAAKPLVDTDVIGKVIDEANLADGVNEKISDAYNDAQTARNEAQQAAQDASDALDEAIQAKIDAQAAATAAGTALTTANGKGRNLYGTSAQIAEYAPYSVHDTWFDTANDNRISRWSGSAWQLAQLGTGAIANASITNALIADATIQSAKIANLDAGKITTGELDAARIGANSITAEKLLIGDFTNLVNGSDFEDPEKIPWNLSNSAFSISTSASRVHSGTKCLYINAGSSTRVAYGLSDFDVQEGDQFFMSVWASRSAAYDGTTGNSKIRVANGDGGSIVAQLDYAAGRMAANAPPIQLTQTFTVPAGVTKLTFSIRADHTAGGLWLDDVVIRRMTAGELIVDGAVTASKIEAGAVTAGKIAANAVTADNIAAGTITADKLTIANLSNLIPDPSTETLDTWTTREGEASRWDTGISATYGTRGFRVNATGDYTSNSRLEPREPVKVNPGEIYACGAHVYRPSGGTGVVGVRIIFRDAGGALVSSGVTTPSVSSGWTDTASIHPVPEGAVTAHFEMYAASNAAGGLYWFMRPWMRPAATGELIVDGAISTDKLAANSVTSEKIVAGSVTAREIAALSVTAGELAANAVTADKIDAGAVTAVKVAANAITGEKIQANAIDGKTITGALVRTAAIGARTEMTSQGLRTLNSSGQELVRIGYGISTGMSVRDPGSGSLVPLAAHVFGVVSGSSTGTARFPKPPVGNGNWTGWTNSSWWTPNFRTQTGRALLSVSGTLDLLEDTSLEYVYQVRIEVRRNDTSAILHTSEVVTILGGTAQVNFQELVAGLPTSADCSFRWGHRTWDQYKMATSSSVPMRLMYRSFFAMPV